MKRVQDQLGLEPGRVLNSGQMLVIFINLIPWWNFWWLMTMNSKTHKMIYLGIVESLQYMCSGVHMQACRHLCNYISLFKITCISFCAVLTGAQFPSPVYIPETILSEHLWPSHPTTLQIM